MYAREADAITWNLVRPEPLRHAIGRRAVVWGALVLIALFGFSKAAQGGVAPGYTTVSVGRGDTVWTIAAQRYPDADAREKVDEIMRANGLSQPVVYPGEELKVPNQ